MMVGMSVFTIDCDYVFPRFAASYLVVEGDHALFVENNTAHSVPRLLHELKVQGLKPDQVRYLIITHVHLDHAGGSEALMKACPNATLLAHPRAAPHMIDPSKLVASARQVYGDQEFARLYGSIGPIDSQRVRAMEDGEELRFGSKTLRFMHTRGHANHHFCVLVSGSQGPESIYTGDSFGLAYPDLQQHGLFVFPSTSPTDFDPVEARKSIDRIASSGAKRAYLTHFGAVDEIQAAARQLRDYLNELEPIYLNWIHSSEGERPDAELVVEANQRIRSYLERKYREKGGVPDSRFWELLKMDIELNASGMVFAAKKKRVATRANSL
jgi:glyoxylase-like metal-dependent hydrolase (beta-lactamase superfamily II)